MFQYLLCLGSKVRKDMQVISYSESFCQCGVKQKKKICSHEFILLGFPQDNHPITPIAIFTMREIKASNYKRFLKKIAVRPTHRCTIRNIDPFASGGLCVTITKEPQLPVTLALDVFCSSRNKSNLLNSEIVSLSAEIPRGPTAQCLFLGG